MAPNQLVEDIRSLAGDMQVGLTDLHGRVASLKVDAADAPALQGINHLITGLIERAQHGDALAQSYASEPDPAFMSPDDVRRLEGLPESAPLPDETTAPAPRETPETAAKTPRSQARSKTAAADSED